MCAETLLYLSNDANPNVIKSVVSAASFVFKEALYIASREPVSHSIAELWSILSQLTRKIVECLQHDNDGVRSHAVHFVEALVLCYSHAPTPPLTVASRKGVNPTVSRRPRNDRVFHLGMVPRDHPLLNAASLARDGERYMKLLFTHLASTELTSTNASVILQAIFNIAKQRTAWWDETVPLLCSLPTSLPPSLSSSQRKSIRISLRSMLLFLLKMPAMEGQHRDAIRAALSGKALDCRRELIESAMRYVGIALQKTAAAGQGSSSSSSSSSARGHKRRTMGDEDAEMEDEDVDDTAEASDVIEADGEPDESAPLMTSEEDDNEEGEEGEEEEERAASAGNDTYSWDEYQRRRAKAEDEDEWRHTLRREEKRRRTVAPETSHRRAEPTNGNGSLLPTPTPTPTPDPSLEFDTPVGRLKLLELVTMVTTTMFRAEIPAPVQAPPPDEEVSLRAFASVILQATSQIPPSDRAFLQNYISHPMPLLESQMRPAQEAPIDPRRRAAMAAQEQQSEQEDEAMRYTFVPIGQDSDVQHISMTAAAAPAVQPPAALSAATVAVSAQEKAQPELESRPPAAGQAEIRIREARSLTDEERNMFLDMTWERILGACKGAARESSQTLRHVLLSRMASKKKPGDNKWYSGLIAHIRGDLQRRLDLAMQWLSQVFANEAAQVAKQRLNLGLDDDGNPSSSCENSGHTEDNTLKETQFPNYAKLLHALLDILETDIQPQFGLALSRFMLQLPYITDRSIEIVCNISSNPMKSLIGLTALKELLLKRRVHRDKCLMKLLLFATNHNEAIRMSAIKIICSQAYPIAELRPTIKRFAIEMMRSILETGSSNAKVDQKSPDALECETTAEGAAEDSQLQQGQNGATTASKNNVGSTTVTDAVDRLEEEKMDHSHEREPRPAPAWDPEDIRRRIMLFLALCALDNGLLDDLIPTFAALSHTTSDQEPKKTLLREAEAFFRDAMDPHSKWLISFFEQFPEDAKELALRVVYIVVEKSKQSSMQQYALFSTIKNIYFGREEKNALFLVPVAHLLTRDEISASLRDMILLDENKVEAVIDKMLTKTKHAQSIAPAQLLVALHQLNAESPDDKPLTKRIIFAINTCFRYKSIFRKNVLASALQQLVDLDPLPLLLMRTVIQSVNAVPEMTGLVVEILSRLVRRRVWENALLWKGFVKCAMMPKLVPNSFEVLLMLPRPELKRALEENPSLRQQLASFVSTKNTSPEIAELVVSFVGEAGHTTGSGKSE